MAKQIKKYGKFALILGLILVLVGMYLTMPISRAGYTTKERDVLSDSRPSTASNHTIYFVTPTGVDATTDTIIIKFDDAGNAFDLTGVVYTDIDLAEDNDGDCAGTWTDEVLVATDTAATNEWIPTINTTTDEISFQPAATNDTGALIAAGVCVQIEIGTHATGPGVNQIDNPTAAVYDIDIAGTFGDTGKTKVAIIAGVTVSATVAESLSVTVNAVTPTNCTTTGGTEVTTTSTTVPFGTVTPETFYDGCQRVDVDTNAANGYGTTVQKTQVLTCSSYTIPDGVCDASCSATTAAAWATSTINGFGYCMDDVAGNAAETADAAWGTNYCGAGTQYFKLIGTLAANAKTIMSSAGPVSGDQSYIGYRLTVDAAQTACTPYDTVISYVVTPTF